MALYHLSALRIRLFIRSFYTLRIRAMNADKRNNRLDGYGKRLLKRSCANPCSSEVQQVSEKSVAFTTATCHSRCRADFNRLNYEYSFACIKNWWSFKNQSLSKASGRKQLQKQHVSISENDRRGSPWRSPLIVRHEAFTRGFLAFEWKSRFWSAN